MKNLMKVMTCILVMFGYINTASAVTLECMEFETFNPNIPHPVGTNFSHDDLFAELVAFQWDDGSWTSDGEATAVNSNFAYGSGQEANLNNINIRYIFDDTQPYIVIFRYDDHGGNVNLGINGFFNNTADLSDLNGMEIGGVQVVVTRHDDPYSHHGSVTLVGPVERFAVGGQEFWIDDVCALFDN